MGNEDTRVDKMLKRLKNNKILASIILFSVIIIAIGSLTDATGKIADFYNRLITSGEPKYQELIDNVSQYVIEGSLQRVNFTGDVIITPVGLFSDPGNLADGSPTGYTYLLCRITNKSSSPVTIGAVLDENETWYRLDDPSFGYRPVATSLVQFQMWFRGNPIKRKELNDNRSSYHDSFIQSSTIEPGHTKYGFINSLGRAWPKEVTFSIVDVTDFIVGSARIKINLNDSKQP
ncbi:hypothetical protein [Winogradskyella sp.]|uniref:hypothetical protein n=1 Tax=Winogradskyella sp. TaxID=1883156 RepID=UPI003BAB2247